MKAPQVLMPRWRCQSYIYIANTKELFYTHEHMMNIFALAACNCKLKEWVMIDHDCC